MNSDIDRRPKIGFLTSSVSRRAGGVFEAVHNLAQSVQASRRHAVRVFGVRDEQTDRDLSAWEDVPVDAFAAAGSVAFGFAPGLARGLEAARPELLHVHGLWMYSSVASLRWARGVKPYIVSPHGMLDRWALQNSHWKKRVAGALYENRHLQGAACLHALNSAEAEAMRAYGLRNPICVIQNGVALPSEVRNAAPPWGQSLGNDARVVFFLGRLHPKKGLEPLLQAWALVKSVAKSSGWHLVLAGWDQGGHEARLRAMCATLGVEDCVQFIGPQFGEAKTACLEAAEAFILPSLSEGLPMTVLEAWAHRLPVLMTPQCNLPQGFEAGAALRMDPEADSIAAQLRRLFAMPETERRAMGQCGRALVDRDQQWPVVAAKMMEVYDWALGAGPKPDVVLN